MQRSRRPQPKGIYLLLRRLSGLRTLFFLSITIVCLVVGLFLFDRSSSPTTYQRISDLPNSTASNRANEPADPEAALQILQKFFEAPDLESKAKYISSPRRVLPLMENYYGKRRHPLPTMSSSSPGFVAQFGGIDTVLFQVEPFSGEPFSVAVLWDGETYRVDWESMTAYSSMDWLEFLDRKPKKAQLLRLFLTEGRQFTEIPNLSSEFQVFLMQHRDHDERVPFAVPMKIGVEFHPLTAGNKRVPVTIIASWETIGDGGPEIPVVKQFLHEGWTTPEQE